MSDCLSLIVRPLTALAVDAPPIWNGSDVYKLLGGLGLFLFGMTLTSAALKAIAGRTLRVLVALLTSNRFLGLIFGAAITVALNSSSATTVLCVSLGNAGLLALRNAGALLLGAGIGTALTVQIMAFNIGDAALVSIGVGAAIRILSETGKRKHLAEMLIGIGLIFYGMVVMKDGSTFLRSHPDVRMFLYSLNDRPLLALAVSAAFTAIIQSSAGTIVIIFDLVISDSGSAPIGMTAAVAMMLGANIGTAATGMLSAIGQSRVGKQIALESLLTRLAGALIALLFLDALVDLSSWSAVIVGADAVSKRAIANSHLIFNIFFALLFLPFLAPLTRLMDGIVKHESGGAGVRTIDLTPDAALTLDSAIHAIRSEGERLVDQLRLVLGGLPRRIDAADPDALSVSRAEIAALFERRRRILDFARLITVKHKASENASARELTGWIEKIGSILRLLDGLVIENGERLFAGGSDAPLESLIDLKRFAGLATRCLVGPEKTPPSANDINKLRKDALRRQSDRLLRGLEEAVGGEAAFRGMIEGFQIVCFQLLRLRERLIAQSIPFAGPDSSRLPQQVLE